MKRDLKYIIPEKYNNYSIEAFLKEQGFVHNTIVQLKKTDCGIMLNNKWAYTIDKLSTNDILTLKIDYNITSSDIEPVNLDFEIVYEDEDILVVNKPSDMPVHPSINNYTNTLANAVMYYYRNEEFVFRCINRLDRDTSGLTIIAKNSLSGAILSKQVSQRILHRTYLAICKGKTDGAGTVNAPIGRKNDSTIERCIDFENGESAITHYKLLSYNPSLDLSLIQLSLETGRTHQIRVHMKHIGHPLIGDFLYNPDTSIIKRQALHSSQLEFIHPLTKEKMQLHIPLPLDMKCIFNDF